MRKNAYTSLLVITMVMILVMTMSTITTLSGSLTTQKMFPRSDYKDLMDDDKGAVSDLVTLNCSKEWSCRGFDYKTMVSQRRGHYGSRSCACDKHCPLMEDCCPDAGFQQLNASAYTPYSLHKSSFSCVYDKSVNEANSVTLVTRCPDNYDDEEVTLLCHNVTDDDTMMRLPVTGKESKVVYRNMYCALCHQEPYLYWTVSVHCTSDHELPYDANHTNISEVLRVVHQQKEWANEEMQGLHPSQRSGSLMPSLRGPAQPPGASMDTGPRVRALEAPQCDLQFKPPEDELEWRPCYYPVIQRCSPVFPRNTLQHGDIVSRCEEVTDRTQRLVFGDMTAYRNQFCALCNFEVNTTCQPLVTASIGKPGTGVRGFGQYSFSILLDINTHRGSTTVGHKLRYPDETVERKEPISCDEGHVYDPFQSTCRTVTCGPGRHFVANMCQKRDLDTPDPRDPANSTEETPHLKFKGDRHEGEENCSFIQLREGEFRLLDNSSVEFRGTGSVYGPSHYRMVDGQLHLCVPFTRNHTVTATVEDRNLTLTFSMTEALVSTCGLCVSLLALAVTAAVHLCLRPLHNVPGRTLLSLTIALFLADLLLLLAPFAAEEFVACAVVAGVMHYLFLASFLWMNVLAVDVWVAFSKAFVRAGDRGRASRRFLLYSAYAWLTPLCFVLSALLLQVFKLESPLSPQYGHVICWLSNKYALMLFFAAPLLILLLLNVVLFVISARNIWSAQRSAARRLGKEEEGRLGIYVRLTVVMGVTWLLGFLAALLPDNLVLRYCFIVMNTLQGLFIFLSFVLTKKVLSLLKDKFCSRSKFRVSKSASTDLTNLSSKSPGTKRKLSTASHKSHNAVL